MLNGADRGAEGVHPACVSGGGGPLWSAQPRHPQTAHLRQPQQVGQASSGLPSSLSRGGLTSIVIGGGLFYFHCHWGMVVLLPLSLGDGCFTSLVIGGWLFYFHCHRGWLLYFSCHWGMVDLLPWSLGDGCFTSLVIVG